MTMKSIISAIVLSVICIVLPSCETEIDLGDIPIEPHLVLNSNLGVDSDTSKIYLTESRATFSTDSYWGRSPYNYINNANVTIYVNDVATKLEYNAVDSAYLYFKPLKAEDKISISANYGELNINTSSTIPDMPEVLSVDTISLFKVTSGIVKQYLKYNVKVRDRPRIKNYYRITIDLAELHEKDETSEIPYWTYHRQFKSDNLILNNGNVNNGDDDISIINLPPNYYGVFSDALFDGKEYTLDFYIPYPLFLISDPLVNKGYLTVTIQCITEDLYKYYSSLQRYQYLNDNDISEPVIVFSNISNGLGILGAHNEVLIMRSEK